MSLSYTTYTADGFTTLFTIPFTYLDSEDVTVLLNGVPTTFTLANEQTVQLATPPANGVVVKVQRLTDITDPAIDFQDGSNITEHELDTAFRQPFFGLQEVSDELQFWVAWVQNQAISGSDLPPISPGNDNSFLLSSGSTWVVRTLGEVKSTLGLGTSTAGYTTIPDPEGIAAFVFTDGTTFSLLPPTAALTALGLGNLATQNASDFPMLSAVSGTAIGNLVVLGNVGGVAGLPAVDGSLLTNVGKEKYLRVEDRKAQNTAGGTYAAAATWVQRNLQSEIVDEIGSATASNYFTLPAGKYRFHVRTRSRINGHSSIRIVTDTGTIITRGEEFFTNGDNDVWTSLKFQDTFGAAVNLRVDYYNTGSWNDSRALGTPANDSELSPEVYTIVEVWKLP
jgi:hypothetical protein